LPGHYNIRAKAGATPTLDNNLKINGFIWGLEPIDLPRASVGRPESKAPVHKRTRPAA
jgi:hypothetical protein